MFFGWNPIVIFMPPPAPSGSPKYAPESLIVPSFPLPSTTSAAGAALTRTSEVSRERNAAQVGR